MAHKWANWLHNPCRQGGPSRFKAWNKISNASGQIGCITLAAWGIPNALERGTKSAVAHKWANWLHDPHRPGGVPNASEQGTKSGLPHKWADWLHNPLLPGGVPNASERETKSPHKWANWLHKPSCPGGRQRFKAWDKISNGPQIGKLAT